MEPPAKPPRKRGPPYSVIVVDDHELYRETLALALGEHPALTVVGAAEDGAAGLALIEALEPDVAVLDLRMPAPDGIQLCRLLTRREPSLRTRLVILTAELSPAVEAEALAAGAAAVLGKRASLDEICHSILELAQRR